jgi:translation initiation factor eIF-2B subunit epsilon
MAPKEVQEEEPLQAVIITDSFNNRYKPLTLDRPRCLLPLGNMPIIDYTLEFLAVSQVQEIFILSCYLSDMVRDYIQNSRWVKSSLPPKIHTIAMQECYSVGDALRELDAKQLLRGDFILVSGDVISNVKLDTILEEHKTRRKNDKDCIMTMVLKKASPTHRLRAQGEESLYILDSKTNQCIHCEPLELYPQKNIFKVDVEAFANHPKVQIRNDLIDCQIDICSLEVPALFTENFDYQDIRKDFVRGILQSDILGKTIYCHILTDQYAARAKSTKMYDAISKDVISRWTFPLTPDSNIQQGDNYRHSRNQIYKDQSVILARSAKLIEKVIVGANTEIGENSRISNSTIGHNCKIGNNVVIENSYIWDNVTIESNCNIYKSFIADNAHIWENVDVKKGCMISYNVEVGPDAVIDEFTKLTLHEPDNDTDYTEIKLGEKCKAYLWEDKSSEDDEDEYDKNEKLTIKMSYLGRENIVQEFNDLDDSDLSSSESEAEFLDEDAIQQKNNREIMATLERAFAENHSIENAALELNTLKMACNIQFRDLRVLAIPAVLNRINADNSAQKIIERWGPLIGKFIHSDEDQIDAIYSIQKFCAKSEYHSKMLAIILKLFYDIEVIEEDDIIYWYNNASSEDSLTEKEKAIRATAEPLIKWLQSAEEESESEEESDDDEEDDDDDDDEEEEDDEDDEDEDDDE